jgi:cysteine-S-conjugate beta-lyase
VNLCIKYNCPIISDEIHCDLLIKGVKHTPTAMISKEIEQFTMTFMSASKTFNIAGIPASVAIIPNPEWRAKFVAARAGQSGVSIFGLVALEAAFKHGKEYLEQLSEYLNENMKYFQNYIETKIPKVKMIKPEGTYLAWVDMRGLGFSNEELREFMLKKAKLALDDGFHFRTRRGRFPEIQSGMPESLCNGSLAASRESC